MGSCQGVGGTFGGCWYSKWWLRNRLGHILKYSGCLKIERNTDLVAVNWCWQGYKPGLFFISCQWPGNISSSSFENMNYLVIWGCCHRFVAMSLFTNCSYYSCVKMRMNRKFQNYHEKFQFSFFPCFTFIHFHSIKSLKFSCCPFKMKTTTTTNKQHLWSKLNTWPVHVQVKSVEPGEPFRPVRLWV